MAGRGQPAGLGPLLAATLAALSLAGCASAVDGGTPVGPGPAAACCSRPEPYPKWLVGIADIAAPMIVPIIGSIEYRDGWIERHPDAGRLIGETLRPLDVIVVVAGGRASLVPGLFDHVALYLGDERQLRAAGLWHDPLVLPLQGRLREGPLVIEAHRDGVRIEPLSAIIDVDQVAVLRPRTGGYASRASALRRALSMVGEPFDFHFDLDTPECLYCVEYVLRSLPQLRVPAQRAYGRRTILPDQMARMALVGGSRLSLALFVAADRAGWRQGNAEALEAALEAAWTRR